MNSAVILSFMIVGVSTWQDIKVGDCLEPAELSELSGVSHLELFEARECSRNLPLELSGITTQPVACEQDLEVGEWRAEFVEHPKAGFFFPRRPPCERSVRWAETAWAYYEPLVTEPSCQDASSDPFYELVFEQREFLETQRFSAGQGQLYLPYPLRVKRRSFFDLGVDVLETCTESRVWLNYTGWGRLSGELQVWNCEWSEMETLRFCRSGRFALGKNSKGNSCVEVTHWEDCLSQSSR